MAVRAEELVALRRRDRTVPAARPCDGLGGGRALVRHRTDGPRSDLGRDGPLWPAWGARSRGLRLVVARHERQREPDADDRGERVASRGTPGGGLAALSRLAS